MVEHNKIGVHVEDVIGVRWILSVCVVGWQCYVLVEKHVFRLRFVIHWIQASHLIPNHSINKALRSVSRKAHYECNEWMLTKFLFLHVAESGVDLDVTPGRWWLRKVDRICCQWYPGSCRLACWPCKCHWKHSIAFVIQTLFYTNSNCYRFVAISRDNCTPTRGGVFEWASGCCRSRL